MAGHHEEFDALTGQKTTGHEWDGIKELNTPLPRWWLWVFYATIVWAVGYWILYPAWPLLSSHTAGLFGWNSRTQVVEQMRDLQALRATRSKALEAASLDQILADPALRAFAIAQGKAAFGDNCAPCHGLGAVGARGFPNLQDDDWIWGGTLTDIHQTIQHGIRNESSEARVGPMPAFGRDGTLKRDEITQVAAYVRTLSGQPALAGVDIAKGKTLFAENCASCHGDDGKGNRDLGAFNLTDRIWLYGGDQASVVETLTIGRGGVMPAFTRLDPVTVKSLTIYVHSLGGGVR